MTVPSETSRSLFTGNGVTDEFTPAFYFRLADELVVTLTPSGGTPVIQTEGVHYAVALPSDVGEVDGLVTMVTPPAADDELKIERTVPFTQETSLRQAGEFDPVAHEDQFDELTFQTQQLDRRVSDIEDGSLTGDFVAGNGLSMAGTTLNVGAGDGIRANADTIEVVFGGTGHMVNADADVPDGGSSPEAARIDHKHRVTVGAPVAIVVGAAGDPGAGTSLALADHEHEVPIGSPVDIDASATADGSSGLFADAEHKHKVLTGDPVEITDSTEAPGVAATLAASDHQHGHGDRGGGSLHALAIAGGDAGFMSGTEKTALAAIGSVAIKSHVHAYQVFAQSMPNGIGGTTCIFGTEDYDADAEYDFTTGIFTAKQAGYLLVTVNYALVAAAYTTAGGGAMALYIVRNRAGDIIEATAYDSVDANVTRPWTLHLSKVVKVAVGDTIRALVGHSQGAAVNSQATRANCSITIDRIL